MAARWPRFTLLTLYAAARLTGGEAVSAGVPRQVPTVAVVRIILTAALFTRRVHCNKQNTPHVAANLHLPHSVGNNKTKFDETARQVVEVSAILGTS